MKKILAALAVTAAFASCKKETVINPETTAPSANKKIVSIQYTDSGYPTEIHTVTYDTQGRLATYTDDDRIYSLSYESASRLIVTSRHKSDNTIQAMHECSLNSKGAILEDKITNPAGALVYTYQYTYDGNNQMFKVKGFDPSGGGYEYVADIVNGNIASAKQYSDGIYQSTTTYYYEGAKPNKIPSTLSGYWPSATLYGKSASLLITEIKSVDPAGALTWHEKSNYVLDADGYITSRLTTYLTSGDTNTAVYQYQ